MYKLLLILNVYLDAVNIEGLAGGTIELPCDLKPQIPGTNITLN